MKVSLIKMDRIRSTDIPDKPIGNFWVTDYDESGKEVNLLNITSENNAWKLVSNQDFHCIINGKKVPYIYLKNYCFYSVRDVLNDTYVMIYTSPSINENIVSYKINPRLNSYISIGSASNCNIVFESLDAEQIKLVYENGKLVLYCTSKKYWVYVNSLRIYTKKNLEYGDVVFVNGFKIIYSKYQDDEKLVICYFGDSLTVRGLERIVYARKSEAFSEPEEELDMRWYKEKDFFHKTPRFVSEIEEKKFKIDVPPSKELENETPVILTVGPMLTMSMSSMVMAFTSVANLRSGNSSFLMVLPTIVMSVAMVAGTILWPSITKKYEKKKRIAKEKERFEKYNKYIDKKRKEILEELNNQAMILKRNFPNLQECRKIIVEKQEVLWQKRIEDEDFLKISLGYGSYPMKIDISYPEEQFSMVEDDLKAVADRLSREPKILQNVPVPYSFMENSISSVLGEYENRSEFLKKIIFQLITFHSYNDLKMVILTDDDKKNNWKNLKKTPYCFSDDKKIRFFASKKEEYNVLCNHLEKIFDQRYEVAKKGKEDPHSYDKIYLIITDSFKSIRNQDFINKLLDSDYSCGFCILISNDNIVTLPNQCKSFIKINGASGELLSNEIKEKKQDFLIDFISNISYNDCYKILSNIPIDITDSKSAQIPEKVSFLEMYDVGKVEQLNSFNRWVSSNPIDSLAVPVAYGKNNEIQYIDLHEKAHGPHGLVAGMTGSGKSEFIISYILSLAVNYNPNEVQFILIDYKGGGLAGAFENANAGKKLPHLVGTITNLDVTEIKRSLSSIESELKRRQHLFNVARDSTGESTIDIYKYQRLYRQGMVKEPISHLFIISDEFAELKTQQPEFMEQLISTARIGRSLGVHLILATQKPSGVVDPQIWSNTRFRVCLRVQDTSDSNEVIKCPDAAYLKQAGRFFFQVGYNEVFTLGQAAWAGEKYIPKEKTTKKLDTSIAFINNIGQTIKSVETKPKVKKEDQKYGEELSNVVSYLADIALEQNIKSKPLWLERIPSFIKIEDTLLKYKFIPEKNIIDIPVGEYDMPTKQQQKLLTIPFTSGGNAIIYGSTGSGKENFMMTLIYSSMMLYKPEDINFYIVDFGSGVLQIFSNSNYVGDIIISTDEEKIINLYKLLFNMVEERKKLFANYGGNYTSYVSKSGKKLPSIVVMINNYDAYQETYEDYGTDFNNITRECIRYGIYFIVTCNSPTAMRFKYKQNFSQIYCLQQNNNDDYSTIMGNVQKTFPSKIYGRGIIRTDAIYEFQTAFIENSELINDTIINKINQTNSENSYKALPVPILPRKVDYNSVKDYIDYNSNNVVIGIEKNSLNISKYNFTKDLVNVISATDITIADKFINSFINQIKANNKFQTILIDAIDNINNSSLGNTVFENKNYNQIFEKIYSYEEECFNLYKENNYDETVLKGQKRIIVLINGLDDFISKLSSENKNKLKDFFTMSDKLNIINFIVIDSIAKIKKYEYEAWFRESADTSSGIFIGNGINDQFVLKISVRTPEVREVIEDDFCFVIQRGRPVLVKYLSEFEPNDLEEIIEY